VDVLSLEKPLSIDGVAVFRDHADPNQFWYLPGPVALARKPQTERAAFSFIKYKPAVAGAGLTGGGFAMFETSLRLPDALATRIRATVLSEPGVTQPRLSPVLFETGTVQCIALDLQGSGGAVAVAPPPGAFNAVQRILGASTPSMDAENRAAFGLSLSQEGATILEQAFTDGLAPIGVIYTFTYSGMRAALDVEIKADLEMIFNHFSASLEAQVQWVRAGIDAAFESLKQTGAIQIKVLNFTGEADEKEQEDWALAFFKDDLLAKWFEPTLTPGQLATAAAQADPLAEVAKFTREVLQGQKPAEGDKPSEAKPAEARPDGQRVGGSTSGATTDAKPADTPPGQPGSGTGAGSQPTRAAATLTPTSVTPAPLPEGRAVNHVPAATGTRETVTVAGAGAVVRANGANQVLNAQSQFTVDVPPEGSVAIEVDWPAAGREETFHLFFDFDKPAAAGWSTNPPSPAYRGYVENTVSDSRYQTASGVAAGDGATWPGSERGRDRLANWLATLTEPRAVTLDAHASFETQAQPGSGSTPFTGDAQREHNMRLSMRRSDVAVAIVARAGASLATAARAHGDLEARGTPGNPATGDPNDRVVKIRGRVAGGPTSAFRGTLARGKTPAVEPPPPTTKPPTTKPPTDPAPKAPPAATSMPGVVSLQLKFIRQEERKQLTLRYNRSEATRRTYAPQGFFGLLLGDLADKDSYFTEVDLDDPFFRELTILAEAPVDFERIGLASAQVALDYGDPTDPRDHKHADFVFRADDKGPKAFTAFLNSNHDIDYRQQQQFNFSPDAGWQADRHSVELPAERTEDRTLFVNPHDVLDFLEIPVTPGDIDTGVIDSIDVTLEAAGPGTFRQTKHFVVVADSPPQIWKLRAPKPVAPETREVSFALTHRLKDGTVREAPAEPLTASALVVHDPFDRALNLEFVPLFDPAAVRQVFIDVEYEDPANDYRRSERLDVPGDQTENVKLRLALLDPDQRQFRFRFTVVGTDGSFTRLAFETSDEEVVPIQV
jgi:hypothetical protein